MNPRGVLVLSPRRLIGAGRADAIFRVRGGVENGLAELPCAQRGFTPQRTPFPPQPLRLKQDFIGSGEKMRHIGIMPMIRPPRFILG